MKEGLEVGATHTARYEIDKDRTIGFMGEELRVYATPIMVRDMENTCRLFLEDVYLDKDENSVGARVEIDHMGPTLVGMYVNIKITVTELRGPKVAFEFEVHDQIEQVGRGKHLRFVVPLDKQRERLEGKRAQLKG
ncbi:MAG: LysR family transcriptional regulator [Alphaproteobacteria bacterium]|jgi:fluoroacetyl-CoA thioesterase|nr:LysR family transcriptional regulator [Alphaproteobacteria bacterium]|tara:strand:- start:1094 stop:1501 length:408 start_codon:yes stop_codon:yes gene_type:complete